MEHLTLTVYAVHSIHIPRGVVGRRVPALTCKKCQRCLFKYKD